MPDAAAFDGFPAGAPSVTLPALLLHRLVPAMRDPAELLVTLYAATRVQRLRRFPRLLDVADLRAERPLVEALHGMLPGADLDEVFQRGLEAALERGTLLRVEAEDAKGQTHTLITLNSAADRRAVARAQGGRLSAAFSLQPPPEPRAAVGIYQLYEDTVGPIAPLIAQELAEAEGLYPADWIGDAFREAAELNKRSWRYVRAILERWMAEGRDDEAAGRDSRERPVSRFDHLIRR